MLEATLEYMRGQKKLVGIIEGDVKTSIDGDRLSKYGMPVQMVNTNGGCHLSPDDIKDAAEKMPLSGLDLLISNAGRNIFRGAGNASNDDWDECMELDLAAHWRLAKAARPHLVQASDSAIVIIGSNHAWHTIPGCFPYNVAKAGLLGLVQSLAIEWGPEIRTVGIAPGFIDTAGNQSWFDEFPDPAAERLRTERMHPVGRIGAVEEVGSLCAFLASPHAGFISGTTLLVDGGRSALLQDGP